jgi:cyclic beta-1,2-glucan synthetase
MQEVHNNQVQPSDNARDAEGFTSNAEKTQKFIDSLIQNLANYSQQTLTETSKFDLPEKVLMNEEIWLEKAHRYFRETSQESGNLTYASEWILDNYYIIRQTLQQIKEDLPANFYKQLPKITNGELAGRPRISVIAFASLTFQRLLFDSISLKEILVELQKQMPLTMGEIWALPIFLRYHLINILSQALVSVINPSDPPDLPALLGSFSFLENPLPDKNTAAEAAVTNDQIANTILSLRAITEQNWNDFFESVSYLEQTLRQDPAGIYPKMDFKTRDLYRKEIEKLSFVSGVEQNTLGKIAIELANETKNIPKTGLETPPLTTTGSKPINHVPNGSSTHVGNFLFGRGRSIFEQKINYRPTIFIRIKNWFFTQATQVYLFSAFIITLLFFISIWFLTDFSIVVKNLPSALKVLPWNTSISINSVFLAWFIVIFLILLLFIPAFTIASSLINWLITLWVPPRVLPKLNFENYIPDEHHSLVVIPAMLTSFDEVESLVNQLELHYLRNTQPGLFFALLTDFRDADQEELEEDEDLINHAQVLIKDLNKRYAHISPIKRSLAKEDFPDRFYLLHRKRLFNPSEGKWMGWERKRGKLLELNHLLRGKNNLSFISSDLSFSALQTVQYVITLDADTILPIGAASRLVGTMGHPLNQPVFDKQTGRVISGYTILQPRIEIHPKSVNFSWFTRIFAGDAGLDLYSLAVSDAYQDLFGEGIYVGKGIYHVDAFEKSVVGHIPENTILSHDLLEGLMGRAGLVTDITMIEDYPQSYLIQMLRQRRWIRGDWQLLPWFFSPKKFGIRFSAIDRWKIFDNLRRSLLAPALVLIFSFGVVFLPGLAGLWTVIVLLSLGIPVLTGLAHSTIKVLDGEYPRNAFRPFSWNLIRWVLSIAFLIYESYIALDAVLTTLYRLIISRRNLLQWTTAAQTTHLFGLEKRRGKAWQKMGISVLLALILALQIQLVSDMSRSRVAPALIYASFVLLLWILSPIMVWWINRPIQEEAVDLNAEQIKLLRQITRRTWGFFEQFVGPEDHWLPPDHYQENPVGSVAHRTSPTNIGLLLTSTLAAYDFGYLEHFGLAARLQNTLSTLNELERFRGHFLNWYDTLTLQPLNPRYISTVDSGNLAAGLIVTSQACKTMPHEQIFRWALWHGYLDTLSNLSDLLNEIRNKDFAPQIKEINKQIRSMHAEILKVRPFTDRWYALFLKASGPFWQQISQQLVELIKLPSSAFDQKALGKLQEVASQIENQHVAVQRTISELFPWIPLFETIPEPLKSSPYVQTLENLKNCLPNNLSIMQILTQVKAALPYLFSLRNEFTQENLLLKTPQDQTPLNEALQDEWVLAWLDQLTTALSHAESNAAALIKQFNQISARCEQMIQEMDFRFLYHPTRRIFHIGYNIDAGVLDKNFYDLLASEARIASLIAIAKGDVPQSHWLYLSRPITEVRGSKVLLSWSGTMFEYLMPLLFLRSYPGTLLADSTRGAVERQMIYAKNKGVPWGISESGFYRFDNNQSYQYRAFGVPGLGFKRGLGDDLVIAPYASLMAIGQAPHAVVQNLRRLIKLNMLGLYGLYEAIDFTNYRLPIDEKYAIVSEYMVHHQGMLMMAMVNFFYNDIMVDRMHRDARIQSVAMLLQEQIPLEGILEDLTADDVKGVQRLTPAPVEIAPWRVPVQTPIPQVHLLSNGSYNVIISNMGGGYSAWRKTSLTRWQPDGVLDNWGSWIFLQDVTKPDEQQKPYWSATHQPVPGDAAEMTVTFFAHMAVFRRSERGIDSTLEVIVAPDDPAEIRRLHLHNQTETKRELQITSYGEVILAPQANDARHPAFNKLFIMSEFIPELNLQIFSRRSRSADEKNILMGHMLVKKSEVTTAQHEADRRQFIGRGHILRDAAALTSGQYLTGSSGATLDPIFSLGETISLVPHQSTDLAYITFSAESREGMLEMANRYQNWSIIDRTFHQANISAHTWLSKQNINKKAFKDILQVLSALIYSFKAVRALPQTIAANQLGQPGLWRFGISGDYPILLVKTDDPKQLDLVREALLVHKFLRSRRYKIDLVLINRQKTDYGAELNTTLYRLVTRLNEEDWLNQNGGIFILYEDQMHVDERILLETAAGVLLDGKAGSLNDQLPGYSIPVRHLPGFTPTRLPESVNATLPPYTLPFSNLPDLKFKNGYGGFSADGKEYIIELPPGKNTPAPWVNVIGYPTFGFMVSESGSQNTWAINSGENRLTPWSNDPVSDPTGEALYLRDEETGEVWSPTPSPAGRGQPYRVRHGAGYTVFENHTHGLSQTLTLIASPTDPIKVIQLSLKNNLPHIRRITATQYVEWVLGTTSAITRPYIIPDFDAESKSLLASNPYSAEFGDRVAFLSASKTIHGLTADRTEFFGRGGSSADPAALKRLGLETRITPGEDPCAVLQVHIDLPPNAEETIYFVLGQGDDKKEAISLAKKYQNPDAVKKVFSDCYDYWEPLLTTIQVKTPQPATDLILNRWSLYQAISCRIWGRTAFYQSSGAFGFRDQLQDVLALLPINPEITRDQILKAARHQFEEGDVLHWWHPPSGRGVRTRITDDLLWMPYVTANYIQVTGDIDILNEKVSFLSAPPLKEEEEERYNEYPQTEQTDTLLDHCFRAIQHASTHGMNGLPLIGTGDWNDGLNKVGEKGRGESVWLAWFLVDVLKRFADVCERIGDLQTAENYRVKAQHYVDAANRSAWDGEWYQRGTYDNGEPLGSSQNLEARIDAIAQSWAVLSGGGSPERSRQAMQSVVTHLVRPENRLSLLFTPPFDQTPHNPGYIKGYLPGIRENGGQYTHAATWTAWAFAALGDGQQAGDLFDLLNPILQADTKEKAQVYRVEPYVICADIYSVEPYIRRGGWTWYTGSAAWTYRLGLEAILGFNKIGETLKIDPVIPPDWDGFEIRYQYGKSTYNIHVKNPDHVSSQVKQTQLDGRILKNSLSIPLVDDQKEHIVEVILGTDQSGSAET